MGALVRCRKAAPPPPPNHHPPTHSPFPISRFRALSSPLPLFLPTGTGKAPPFLRGLRLPTPARVYVRATCHTASLASDGPAGRAPETLQTACAGRHELVRPVRTRALRCSVCMSVCMTCWRACVRACACVHVLQAQSRTRSYVCGYYFDPVTVPVVPGIRHSLAVTDYIFYMRTRGDGANMERLCNPNSRRSVPSSVLPRQRSRRGPCRT